MSAEATDALLDVRGLSVTFRGGRGLSLRAPEVPAVRDVSFAVRRKETLGLVGESGSGKTTTGRAVLRLVDVAGGTVRFDGTDVTAMGRHTPLSYRRAVQPVFQDPSSSLNPKKVVLDAVAEPLRRHGVGTRAEQRAHAAQLFDRVGLSAHYFGRFPGELSGGQQQRVAIARALALTPQLVVCDEAVSALDVSTQSQIVNLLEDLQAEFGLSYLFIAHDLSVVRHISRRVAVMYGGLLVEQAPTEELFQEPRHPYTRALLAASPVPDVRGREARRAERRRLRGADGTLPADERLRGCPFRARCPHVMDRCHDVTPKPVPMGAEASVACHLYEPQEKVDD